MRIAVSRYYFTLKHLKPVQFYGRVLFKLLRPKSNLAAAPPLRKTTGIWQAPARRRISLLDGNRCCFLNVSHDISTAKVWNDPARDKLWLYNLHYFDDLNASDAEQRKDWHKALIARWIQENPPGQGNGWEPYPLSLRIVNWIKWALAGNALEPAGLDSLVVQARWLVKRLEWHLLGNHLFANAKALVFAGLFFDGPEAATWLDKGMAILAREIPEQILADGGQFELSPMYHALALEDMLDLANLAVVYSEALPPRWQGLTASWPQTIANMRDWLVAMCHPDGEIGLFNDAAMGIAPTPVELKAYAERLSHPPLCKRGARGDFLSGSAEIEVNPPYPPLAKGGQYFAVDGISHLPDSGYVRIQHGAMLALLDDAPIGPDYLPGHAHADTLSFELSLYGQRVLVNSGTSRYGTGPQRLWQRGTAAHNTVTINGADSSEVWGGFRVARRAKPFGLHINENTLQIRCAHDGYTRLPGKPVHQRQWRFAENSLEIIDTISGPFANAIARFYFHPDVQIETDKATLPNGQSLRWQIEGANSQITAAEYYPEFGVTLPNQCLQLDFSGPRCVIRFVWEQA
jgi:uncharacterized heparinase superfamily protein